MRNGLFVFCVIHPVASRGRKIRSGERIMWDLGSYFNRRKQVWTWKIGGKTARFYGYHRTFQDYFNSLVSAGFTVERILEPEPYDLYEMTEAKREKIPYFEEKYLKDFELWKRIPFTLLFKTKKC